MSIFKGDVKEPIEPSIVLKREGLLNLFASRGCNRRFFCFLPVKHQWQVVRNTGIYMYEECILDGCQERRIHQYRSGYQPKAMGWENVTITNLSS